MSIPYSEALEIIKNIAQSYTRERSNPTQSVTLHKSLGRVAAIDHASPISTPPHDTSAMDGYAISSTYLSQAGPSSPVKFAVEGTIAAGDDPISLSNVPNESRVYPCVEIMTGARFPHNNSGPPFDACVKIEDVISLGWTGSELSKAHAMIAVSRTLLPCANRRFAGNDLRRGNVILRKSQPIQSRHIMALSSVGIHRVNVVKKLRVAIWATGNELSEGPNETTSQSQIFNSNGPFLVAALQELGFETEYQGILRDDPVSLRTALDSSAGQELWDLIITTGAVSKGKFDFIVPALEELHADIHFHGVAIRPGHPVLFASTKRNGQSVPFFGLPGNPVATAACFRFLVVPFLRTVLGLKEARGKQVKLPACATWPSHLDCFRHGAIKKLEDEQKVVEFSANQSPAVISQFARSEGWIHIPCRDPRTLENGIAYFYAHDAPFS